MNSDVTHEQYSARRGWAKLALALVAGLLIMMSMVVLTMVTMARLPGDELFKTGAAELVSGLLAATAVFVLGGRKWLSVDRDCIAYAFGISWMLLIVGILDVLVHMA